MALVQMTLSAIVAVILMLAVDTNPAGATKKKYPSASGPSQGFTISDGPTRRSSVGGPGYSGRGRSGHPTGYVQGAGILGALMESELDRQDELDAQDLAADDRAVGRKPQPRKPRNRSLERTWHEGQRDGLYLLPFSDRRVKDDIVKVARLDNGIGLYRYRYQWSDQLYVGVMAQEVRAVAPDAVVRGADGYLRVDYAKLGLRLQTWNEWRKSDAGLAYAD